MGKFKKDSGFKKKGKTFLGFLFSDIGIITVFLILQIYSLWVIYRNFVGHIIEIYALVGVIDFITALFIISKNDSTDIKITWIMLLFLMPVLGTLLYVYAYHDPLTVKIRKTLTQHLKTSDAYIKEDEEMLKEIENYPDVKRIHNYLKNNGSIGVYSNCDTTYFKNGEKAYQDMLEELSKAKNFIFLEYFIIEDGYMWQSILDILVDKAKKGVDVKILYDGSCDFKKLPRNYYKYLNSLGIHTVKFGTIYPVISITYNFRDHRKIMIIDGKIAYTGGINIADEYINAIHPYGYWKDTVIKVEGEAVKSFTLMFLQMFNLYKNTFDIDYLYASQEEIAGNKGFVIPFADGPLDSYQVGETVYLDIINYAQKYVYIMTPYLITDSSMEKALMHAAAKGIDVRIILPGVADKKIINTMAKSRYDRFTKAGIKIYEYQYGFLHAKMIISDSLKAVVGSINCDYRSFFHNYENAVYVYGTDSIKDIEDDFIETINNSHLINAEDIKTHSSLIKRIIIGFTRFFETLL